MKVSDMLPIPRDQRRRACNGGWEFAVWLSTAEAKALWLATDNSIGSAVSDDARKAVLGHAATVRAGLRALNKLRQITGSTT